LLVKNSLPLALADGIMNKKIRALAQISAPYPEAKAQEHILYRVPRLKPTAIKEESSFLSGFLVFV
jgi:hypothetical protein